MKIRPVNTKSIITRSNIPGIDYVINPYIGCQHACIYCYAEFMKRFTGHGGEIWGEFLDVKQFGLDKIKPESYDGKTILLSSVTDPYTPLEAKYENTRRVLERLISTKANIQILTKSSLVERDIDLFQQFKHIQVAISISTLDAEFARIIEPRASKPEDRLRALHRVSEHGISTYVFMSPIFPRITDWKAIIDAARPITNEFHFENLNFRSHNTPRIMGLIAEHYPDLSDFYNQIRKDSTMWDALEGEIDDHCKMMKLKCNMEFHQGGFTKDR
jgi:DNA repair photolyase